MPVNIWPVVHIGANRAQNKRNIDLARQFGQKVCLIQMQGLDEEIHPWLIYAHGLGLWVVVNFLSLSSSLALKQARSWGAFGVWSDRPDVSSDHISSDALEVQKDLALNSKMEFFSSVAFKYQAIEPDPVLAAQKAFELGFVPTTSGCATGVAADVLKIKKMGLGVAGVGQKPRLALASGVTPDNFLLFSPYITDLFVSTGISKTPDVFDEKSMSDLYALNAS